MFICEVIMDISKDRDAYLLSKILDKVAPNENGTEFLIKYWIRSGRLKYTQVLLRNKISIREDEIQYLINVENLCEELIKTLRPFVREPYCKDSKHGFVVDSSVQQVSLNLISEFEDLKRLSLRYGWKEFTESFAKAVFQIEAIIARLEAMHSTGRPVCFCTNVSPEAFLNASEINFSEVSNKYFILKH